MKRHIRYDRKSMGSIVVHYKDHKKNHDYRKIDMQVRDFEEIS